MQRVVQIEEAVSSDKMSSRRHVVARTRFMPSDLNAVWYACRNVGRECRGRAHTPVARNLPHMPSAGAARRQPRQHAMPPAEEREEESVAVITPTPAHHAMACVLLAIAFRGTSEQYQI